MGFSWPVQLGKLHRDLNKRLVALLVLSTLALNWTAALAGPFEDVPTQVPQETVNRPSDSSAEDYQFVDQDVEKTNSADIFIANQDQIVEEVLDLAIRLEDFLAEKRSELGEAAVSKLILSGGKDVLTIHDSEIGWAEPTTIDKVRVTRVVHRDSGIAFLILPPEVSPDSIHLTQYIARTNLYGGADGRHVLVLRLSTPTEDMARYNLEGESVAAQSIAEIAYHAKPQTFRERIVTMKRALWAGHPDGPMVAMAAIFSGAQAIISGAMGFTQNILNHQGPAQALHNIDWRPAVLSLGFGMVIGSYSSTWKNFTNMPKSRFQRTLRNSILSFAFAYSMKIWVDGGFQQLSLIDTAGLLAHSSIWANVIVNNITKDYWSEFSRIREEKGLNRGKIFKYFQRTNFEYQAINLGSYTLKMFDLVNFSVHFPIWGVMKLGKALFVSSMVYVQWFSVKYAEALKYERTGELRARWNDFVRLGPVRRAPAELVKALKTAFSAASGYCSRLLTGDAPPRAESEK